eukprot:TRINITY_DN26066_c0_g1_i3.p1 TRINITY_DN26066_c0_g1~~TRINITY_DN26066_c0_g1_i3.p1  ORF type:complete len:450 (+),score=40.64 TRINITY_DN26066_c0_g1_i3:48-1397(+)
MPPPGWWLLDPLLFFPNQSSYADLPHRDCWDQQFFPELCCEPPRGFPACFLAEGVTYDLCCPEFHAQQQLREAAGRTAASRAANLFGVHDLLASVKSQSAVKKAFKRKPSVGLMIRSWSGDQSFLEELLFSIAVFWPFGELRTKVVVVMDLEEPETDELCDFVRLCCSPWAECVGEQLPSWLKGVRDDLEVGKMQGQASFEYKSKRPKNARVNWSLFYADHYTSDTDFVGVLDTDIVFHSFGAEALLFAPPLLSRATLAQENSTGPEWHLRPVVFGAWSATLVSSALSIREDYPEASFTDSWPMLVRREDFAGVRKHMIDRFEELSGKRLSFDEVFANVDYQVDFFASTYGWWTNFQGDPSCFECTMAHFLWKERRQHYSTGTYTTHSSDILVNGCTPHIISKAYRVYYKKASAKQRHSHANSPSTPSAFQELRVHTQYKEQQTKHCYG